MVHTIRLISVRPSLAAERFGDVLIYTRGFCIGAGCPSQAPDIRLVRMPTWEGWLMYANASGKQGSAFLLTQDARLASQVNASLAPLAPSFAVFSDELELLRSLRHSPCELLVFDATCVASDDSSLLAWQRCHSGHPTPLIVLGRFDCPNDILAWYRAGAQDVLALPFNSHELHVRAALAISPVAQACPETQQLSVGPYQLIRDENTVYLHGKPIVFHRTRVFDCLVAVLQPRCVLPPLPVGQGGMGKPYRVHRPHHGAAHLQAAQEVAAVQSQWRGAHQNRVFAWLQAGTCTA